jgi:TonB family protein
VVQRFSDSDLADLRERLNLRAGAGAGRATPALFNTANLNANYRPLRGLICSVLFHAGIVGGLMILPLILGLDDEEDFRKNAVILRVDELDKVVYLPLLTSNLEESPAPTPKEHVKAPAKMKEGLSYPGPQPILSDPPMATNHFQTVLQPSLIHPPALQPLALPNIVRMSEPPRLAPPAIESRFKALDATTAVSDNSTRPLAPVDIPLSASVRSLAPPIVESKFKVPDATTPIGPTSASIAPRVDLTSTTPPGPPMPPKPPDSDKKPNSTQDLLSLSPTPTKPDQTVAIPAGETRGRFAISPDPNLSFPGTDPGMKGDGKNKDDSSAKPSTADNASKTAAPLTGSKAFEGITILGGVDGPGELRSSRPEPLQTSYGITILASGGSGGGLKDFGVFGNEQVQTAYLDMRRSVNDRALSWTVEYAIGQKELVPINGVVNISIRQEVVLPFPINKERPDWPQEIAQKYAGRLVIAFATITTEGNLDHAVIKESPDPLLNAAVLSALQKWTFRPARRDGEVATAKMLLGIPVMPTE